MTGVAQTLKQVQGDGVALRRYEWRLWGVQMLKQVQHDGMNEAGHSELDSESVEGECKTYTDAESSSA